MAQMILVVLVLVMCIPVVLQTLLLVLVNNINKILTFTILQIVMDDGPLESHLSAHWMNNGNNELVYL